MWMQKKRSNHNYRYVLNLQNIRENTNCMQSFRRRNIEESNKRMQNTKIELGLHSLCTNIRDRPWEKGGCD